MLSSLLSGILLIDNPVQTATAEEHDYTINEPTSKKIAYVSTLGELLSYTLHEDDVDGYFVKKYSEYIIILANDMDVNTDTSWHKFAPDWETHGWQPRVICASVEGGGHTISNLWVKPPDVNGPRRIVGLFMGVTGGFVRNLNITYDNSKMIQKPDIISDDRLAYFGDYGGLTNSAYYAQISNVHVKGNFYLAGTAGGIVNWPIYSTIDNCSFEGELMGGDVGGISCYTPTTSIKNCLFKGSITAIGGGGICDRPSSTVDDGSSIIVEFSNNLSIITDIQEIDIGIYNKECRQRGTFFGNILKTNTGLRLSNNYVLNVEGYSHTSASPGPNWEMGKPTEAINFLPEEVTGFDSIADLADKSNFAGLDFEKYWYMDTDAGHPKLKRNFVSIIDLTDESLKDNFVISTEDRMYAPDENSKVTASIRDKDACQLIYFTLDGKDVREKLTPNSLPLFMDTNHILVVKAERPGSINFNLENITSLKINNSAVEITGENHNLEYRLGDEISFCLEAATGCELRSVTADSGFTLDLIDGVYFLTIPQTSTFEMPGINIIIDIQKPPEPPVDPPKDNDFLDILLPILGGVIVIAAIALLVVRAINKNKY